MFIRRQWKNYAIHVAFRRNRILGIIHYHFCPFHEKTISTSEAEKTFNVDGWEFSSRGDFSLGKSLVRPDSNYISSQVSAFFLLFSFFPHDASPAIAATNYTSREPYLKSFSFAPRRNKRSHSSQQHAINRWRVLFCNNEGTPDEEKRTENFHPFFVPF